METNKEQGLDLDETKTKRPGKKICTVSLYIQLVDIIMHVCQGILPRLRLQDRDAGRCGRPV